MVEKGPPLTLFFNRLFLLHFPIPSIKSEVLFEAPMMDILGLHAFWICFHGTEKGKLSKWRIWHYSALTLSCNIYRSKTPFSERFNLKTAPAKVLFLIENNVGAATVQKNVPHPVENPSNLYIQNELGYILKPVMSFLPNQHPLYFNINLFW